MRYRTLREVCFKGELVHLYSDGRHELCAHPDAEDLSASGTVSTYDLVRRLDAKGRKWLVLYDEPGLGKLEEDWKLLLRDESSSLVFSGEIIVVEDYVAEDLTYIDW